MTDQLRDHVAERQLLAIALHGHTDHVLALPAEAFDHWQYQEIARAVRKLATRGRPTDPAVVARLVVTTAGGDARARQMGGEIARLASDPVPASSAGYYAERLGALHAARQVTFAAETFRRKVVYAAEHDDDEVLTGATIGMRAAIEQVETAFRPEPIPPPMSLGELLAQDDDPYDWLVPHLLERTDRCIVTGFEGHGKSIYLAMLGLAIAGGIHPFTHEPLDDQDLRTLVFDCENSKRQLRRRYQRISGMIDRLRVGLGLPPANWFEAVRLVSRPEGVALTEPRELARIEQNVAATAPDVVVVGPLYKMSIKLDLQEEQAAQELVGVLDGLRIRHGFTLLAEAHAGHVSDAKGNRKARPIGSSLFLRWPEFGYGLVPTPDCARDEHPSRVELRHWRGARDERAWPAELHHGQTLPWQPPPGDYHRMLAERGFD